MTRGRGARLSRGVDTGAQYVGGRYRLHSLVGRGAMGEVYRATDEGSGRIVALKRFKLSRKKLDDQQRFRREFHTLARLQHPRIARAYDFGIEHGRPFYTMELLDGQDLGEVAPLPWQQACYLLRDVASALAFLHTHGSLHRDVAPRNVRCTSDGRAKLFDFGMLATMGVSNEVVGTLPSIAPEMILGLPMDGRADLFGVGALGFWLLTARHPGRVRSLEDLLRNGRQPPPPPSSLLPEIPGALDELILSLLSPEPLARPASAAEVIERLEAIGGLPAAPELEIARGYVHSAALVGRKREMAILHSRLTRAASGAGGAMIIEGTSGMGKTRLLREIELEAKLLGATVVRARGDAGGPYALAREVAEQLIASLPGALDGPGSTRVGQLLSPLDLADNTGVAPVRDGVDHRQERLELQASLSTWVSNFTRQRPVVLLVDDVQRVDEGSAAVLASLAYAAHEHALMLVCAWRTDDDDARPTLALDKLREQAALMRARGLANTEVEQLLRTVFGDVAGASRLAASMHRVTGGSPMLCVELVRDLIDRGVVRYRGGIWMIPDQVDDEALPRRLEQAMDARIESLGPLALGLCEAMAVRADELTLAQCVELTGSDDESSAFSAIDELVRKGVVIGSTDRYRLAHDGLLDATLRTLSGDARRKLELRIGKLLESEGQVGPALEARIGWHLVRGGEQARGAKLLARSGRRLFEATSFEDALPHLEAALEIYRERGAEPRLMADLYAMLITAGFYSDRDVVERHHADALHMLARYSGVNAMFRLRRYVGGYLGFVLGVVFAMLAYYVRGGSRHLPHPIDALRKYGRGVAYRAGVAGFSFRTEALREASRQIEPFFAYPRPELLLGARFVCNVLNFNLGRIGTLMRTSEQTLSLWAEQPPGVTDVEVAMGTGGARFQRGLVAVRSGSPGALEEIRALRALGNRMWDAGALQLRTYYHMWRGEEALARELRTQAELEFVRLGSLWQMDAVHDPSAALIYAYLGDVLGLKRSIEAIARAIERGMGYQQHHDVALGEYHRLRGEYDAAHACIDRAIEALPPSEGLVRPWALAARADTFLDAGDDPRAMQAAQAAVEHSSDPEYGQVPYRFRAGTTRALACARAGDPTQAKAEVDVLLKAAKDVENPFIIGALYEARALIALSVGDHQGAEAAASAVEARFSRTRNPVLIARCERLRRRVYPEAYDAPDARESGEMVTQVIGHETISSDTLADMLTVLSGCHTATARAVRSLDLILTTSGADRGFLFVSRHGQTSVAAPPHGDEPPLSVAREVDRMVEDAQTAVRGHRHSARFVAEEDQTAWVSRILRCTENDAEIVVGAVAILQPENALPAPPPALLEAIARRLFDAGDIALTPLAARR